MRKKLGKELAQVNSGHILLVQYSLNACDWHPYSYHKYRIHFQHKMPVWLKEFMK